ncbi:hypothetical protein ACTHO0_20920 [Cytobacillus praedii]|uniref:hypothetical protein n=1 Tax=Cytobacillus praedii TaxID=1742358 RepID=UPI003F8053A3
MPIIDTAMSYKDAGIKMIGVSMTNPPVEALEKTLLALSENMNEYKQFGKQNYLSFSMDVLPYNLKNDMGDRTYV